MTNSKTTKRSKTALPGASRLNAFAMAPDGLIIIGLDTDDGPSHPLYDERVNLPLDDALVRNIRAYGVMEPVLVRKNGQAVEVVAGRQRVRAARKASRMMVEEGFAPLRVPVMVRREKDGQALGVMISENELRMRDTPIVRATKAQKMIDYGYGIEEVATTFGVGAQTIKQLLTLLDLDDHVQGLVERGRLSATAASTLNDLSREEQRSRAKEMVANGSGVEEARRQRRERASGSSSGSSPTRGKKVKVKRLREMAADEQIMGALHPQARDMLLWVLGDEEAGERIREVSS